MAFMMSKINKTKRNTKKKNLKKMWAAFSNKGVDMTKKLE